MVHAIAAPGAGPGTIDPAAPGGIEPECRCRTATRHVVRGTRRPPTHGSRTSGDDEIEGPLEDSAAVLREPVDLAHSLLDEAELGTEEVPPALAEMMEAELAADQADAVLEAGSVLVPAPPEGSDDEIEPEELEIRLESESDGAELLSLHDEEQLSEALLDEGPSLGEEEPDAVEEALERAEEPDRAEPTSRLERPGVAGAARAPKAPLPDGQEMIDPARFRRLLEAARQRLESLQAEFEAEGLRQRSEREDLSSLSSIDQHPADQGTETFDRERDLSIREQVEGEFAEVTKALQRLEAGTYGRCEACGRPIGVERLEAEPATRFCLDDQLALGRELESKHREVEA